MKANCGPLVANFKAEMKDLRNEMKGFRNSIKSDMQKRVSMNERIMYAYCVVGFFVLVYVAELLFGREEKVARALELERSQTACELVAGAVSGEGFTKNVQRAAHQKRIEPSS